MVMDGRGRRPDMLCRTLADAFALARGAAPHGGNATVCSYEMGRTVAGPARIWAISPADEGDYERLLRSLAPSIGPVATARLKALRSKDMGLFDQTLTTLAFRVAQRGEDADDDGITPADIDHVVVLFTVDGDGRRTMLVNGVFATVDEAMTAATALPDDDGRVGVALAPVSKHLDLAGSDLLMWMDGAGESPRALARSILSSFPAAS